MEQLKKTKQPTTQHTNYELIRGTFGPEDASEIINHMLQKKIDFHEVRNFSNEVRFGLRDEMSVERIYELKEIKSEFSELIARAQKEGRALKVRANISVELI